MIQWAPSYVPSALNALGAALAASWDFPRAIQDYEIEHGIWLMLGDRFVWWHEPYVVEGYDMVHIAAAPEVRGRWPIRYWQEIALELARERGSHGLAAVPPDGNRRLVNLMLRHGWREQGELIVLEGATHGEGGQEAQQGVQQSLSQGDPEAGRA